MNSQRSNSSANIITEDALRALVGNVDDATVIDILNLQPSLAELEEAVVWAPATATFLGKADIR